MAEPAATAVASTNGTASATEALKPTEVVPEATDAYDDDAGEEDEYDFEEEQQAVEGEGDEYTFQGRENDDDDDEDDDYEEEDSGEVGDLGDPDVAAEPQASGEAAPATNGKPSLTALLLGDPNAGEEDEGDYDEEEDYDDEEDDGDDYVEEATPITPTSKKRAIEETLDDGEADEEAVSKKVKS